MRARSGIRLRGSRPGDRAVNNWHYRFTPRGDGTDVTESFRLNNSLPVRVFWMFAGLRGRRNVRDMRTTLERIKKVVKRSSRTTMRDEIPKG